MMLKYQRRSSYTSCLAQKVTIHGAHKIFTSLHGTACVDVQVLGFGKEFTGYKNRENTYDGLTAADKERLLAPPKAEEPSPPPPPVATVDLSKLLDDVRARRLFAALRCTSNARLPRGFGMGMPACAQFMHGAHVPSCEHEPFDARSLIPDRVDSGG